MTILNTFIIILFSYTIGVLTSPFLSKFRNRKEKSKELPKRRGLLKRSFRNSNHQSSYKSTSFDSVFEVIEIERTSDKSKVKVIDCHSNKSEYNSGESKKDLIKMVDGAWILSTEIEWIVKSKQEEREEKLEKLLNN